MPHLRERGVGRSGGCCPERPSRGAQPGAWWPALLPPRSAQGEDGPKPAGARCAAPRGGFSAGPGAGAACRGARVRGRPAGGCACGDGLRVRGQTRRRARAPAQRALSSWRPPGQSVFVENQVPTLIAVTIFKQTNGCRRHIQDEKPRERRGCGRPGGSCRDDRPQTGVGTKPAAGSRGPRLPVTCRAAPSPRAAGTLLGATSSSAGVLCPRLAQKEVTSSVISRGQKQSHRDSLLRGEGQSPGEGRKPAGDATCVLVGGGCGAIRPAPEQTLWTPRA